jgi:hypothetical protein
MDGGLWEWVDGRGSSVVSEWGLICHDKFKAGIPASLFFFACVIGIAFSPAGSALISTVMYIKR